MSTTRARVDSPVDGASSGVYMIDSKSAEFRFLRRVPSQARASKTILDILRACEELLGEHEESEITIDQIAARANVQAGSVYFFFKDKVHIFFCLIDYSMRELAQQYVFTAEEKQLELTLFLKQFEARLARLWTERRRMMNLYFAYRAHPSMRPTIADVAERMDKAMAEALGHYFQSFNAKRRLTLALVINNHITHGLDVAATLSTSRVAAFRSEWRKVLLGYLAGLK